MILMVVWHQTTLVISRLIGYLRSSLFDFLILFFVGKLKVVFQIAVNSGFHSYLRCKQCKTSICKITRFDVAAEDSTIHGNTTHDVNLHGLTQITHLATTVDYCARVTRNHANQLGMSGLLWVQFQQAFESLFLVRLILVSIPSWWVCIVDES